MKGWRRLELNALAEAVAGFFYPPVCIGCHAAVGRQQALCPSCWRELSFIERPFCAVLGLPFAFDEGEDAVSPLAIADPPPFGRARAAVLHEGLAARLVAALKYSDRTDLALPMGAWMARAGADLLPDAEIVVPVPLHSRRLLRRRFNQSAELARALCRQSGLPYRPLALKRVKATVSQVGLKANARAANLRGAFLVPPGRRAEIEGRRVLLVDDVYTTGSTVRSATLALKRAGAREVDVLTFSRVAKDVLAPHMSP